MFLYRFGDTWWRQSLRWCPWFLRLRIECLDQLTVWCVRCELSYSGTYFACPKSGEVCYQYCKGLTGIQIDKCFWTFVKLLSYKIIRPSFPFSLKNVRIYWSNTCLHLFISLFTTFIVCERKILLNHCLTHRLILVSITESINYNCYGSPPPDSGCSLASWNSQFYSIFIRLGSSGSLKCMSWSSSASREKALWFDG